MEANEPKVKLKFVNIFPWIRLSSCLSLPLIALTSPHFLSCYISKLMNMNFESLMIGLYSTSFTYSFTQCLLFIGQVCLCCLYGLGLGVTARNKKGQKYLSSWSLPHRRQTINKHIACQMMLSAMEKNEAGKRVGVPGTSLFRGTKILKRLSGGRA